MCVSHFATIVRSTDCQKSPEGYVRSKDWIFSKIDELLEVGGDLFAFNGGFNPDLKIEYYVDLFGIDPAEIWRAPGILRDDCC